MMKFDEFVKNWNGKFADFDGWFGAQCFDLFQFYNRDVVGGSFVPGNGAADIWATYPKELYGKVDNTPDAVPQVGDVVIWKGSFNGGVGHVGIATGKGDINSFECFEQNDPTGSSSHLKTYKYDYIYGWLRPKIESGCEKRYATLAAQYSELKEKSQKDYDKLLDDFIKLKGEKEKVVRDYIDYQEQTAAEIAAKIEQAESLQKQASEMTAQLSVMAGQIKSALGEKNATHAKLEALDVKFQAEIHQQEILRGEVATLRGRLAKNIKGYKKTELLLAILGW